MTNPTSPTGRIDRTARLQWVPIPAMKVNPLAQREINQARVDKLCADLDLEQIGTPTVNHRDGAYYIIDGQHRIAALRQYGFDQDKIQCWVYEGLSEQDEAEKFLKLSDTLTIAAIPKYRAAITAGREAECEIDRIVRAAGLVVSSDKIPGAIGAVGTLRRVYERSDAKTLARTLRIVRDAYGDAGMEAVVIDGIGLLCQRYNGQLDDEAAIARLKQINGGVSGLTGNAEKWRLRTGNQKGHCVAAAAVDAINVGKGGKKLPSWWKGDE